MGNFRGWEWIVMLVIFVVVPALVIVMIVKLVSRSPSKSGSGTAGVTPAGWLPDPSDLDKLRYWDGQRWTGNTTQRDP